jgi:hypothetical protein
VGQQALTGAALVITGLAGMVEESRDRAESVWRVERGHTASR